MFLLQKWQTIGKILFIIALGYQNWSALARSSRRCRQKFVSLADGGAWIILIKTPFGIPMRITKKSQCIMWALFISIFHLWKNTLMLMYLRYWYSWVYLGIVIPPDWKGHTGTLFLRYTWDWHSISLFFWSFFLLCVER